MALPTNITGQRFGRLVALRFSHHQGVQRAWLCQCDCGNTKTVVIAKLHNGNTQSCGCFRREHSGNLHRKHGMRQSREYRAWSKIKERCFNPNVKSWPNYGGRGISMHPEWKNSFEAFFRDMGPCPANMSIDRWPNNNGNYTPDNCRWANRLQQANNKRTNRSVIFRGKPVAIQMLSKKFGVPYKIIWQRWTRDKVKGERLIKRH